jgi:helicase
MMISEMELDQRVKDIIASKGITEFYPPQAEALEHVLAGKNVVLAIPTASGKSLVAYIGILRRVLEGKKALYIVPLRALAS